MENVTSTSDSLDVISTSGELTQQIIEWTIFLVEFIAILGLLFILNLAVKIDTKYIRRPSGRRNTINVYKYFALAMFASVILWLYVNWDNFEAIREVMAIREQMRKCAWAYFKMGCGIQYCSYIADQCIGLAICITRPMGETYLLGIVLGIGEVVKDMWLLALVVFFGAATITTAAIAVLTKSVRLSDIRLL